MNKNKTNTSFSLLLRIISVLCFVIICNKGFCQHKQTPTSCDTCIGGLNLTPGKTYLVSVWAKDSITTPGDTTYLNPELIISFPDVHVTYGPFYPQGMIIDGWQRIEAQFTVPTSSVIYNIDQPAHYCPNSSL